MHALIIEDQYLIAALVEAELQDIGFESFEMVDTEAEAIRAAEERCPDIIVADQRLTEGSGVEAIRTICANRSIPFVFLTDYHREVLSLIPHAVVVPKPFVGRSFREAVGEAVAASQRKAEA